MAKPENVQLPVVRLATPADEDGIVAMTHRLHEENGLFSLNEEKVRDCVQRCFRREGTIVGVIGTPDRLEASTCLAMSDFYYTDDMHLAELWNFVDKPYRRSHNAEALINYGMDCARQIKLPLFTGIITNKKMSHKVRLYRRILGSPAGAFFLYNGAWQAEPLTDNGTLRERLREGSQKCAENKITTRTDLVQLSTLLREAALALKVADDLWGSPPKSATPS